MYLMIAIRLSNVVYAEIFHTESPTYANIARSDMDEKGNILLRRLHPASVPEHIRLARTVVRFVRGGAELGLLAFVEA